MAGPLARIGNATELKAKTVLLTVPVLLHDHIASASSPVLRIVDCSTSLFLVLPVILMPSAIVLRTRTPEATSPWVFPLPHSPPLACLVAKSWTNEPVP